MELGFVFQFVKILFKIYSSDGTKYDVIREKRKRTCLGSLSDQIIDTLLRYRALHHCFYHKILIVCRIADLVDLKRDSNCVTDVFVAQSTDVADSTTSQILSL